jgi:dynein heavy chain, axonemal
MRKGLYGPWPQNNCVIFVDELNLAVKDAYGSEPPIELLRQYLDYGGWYDLEDNNKSFKKIINTTLLASMGLPGKNRTFISPRLLGQMSLTSLTSFEDETLNCIYSVILNWFFTTSNFNAEVSKTKSKIISSTLQIYNAAADQFLPSI